MRTGEEVLNSPEAGVCKDNEAGAVLGRIVDGGPHQLLPRLLACICIWDGMIADVLCLDVHLQQAQEALNCPSHCF